MIASMADVNISPIAAKVCSYSLDVLEWPDWPASVPALYRNDQQPLCGGEVLVRYWHHLHFKSIGYQPVWNDLYYTQ